MSAFINRTGEKHLTNEGYAVEIVEYFGVHNCTVQFEDGTIIKNKRYSDTVRGKIKNPHHKSVCNTGFIGLGNYRRNTHFKIYKTWNNMLARCYCKKCQKIHPTYKGCLVLEEWHNFQNFAKWHEENYKEDFALDKDILVKGNKIYSPETCCFVPQEINNLLIKRDMSRGKYLIGTSKFKNKFQVFLNIKAKTIYLGAFDTTEEGFQAYKTVKESYIKDMANEWKDLITTSTYQALINYQVEITD